jgi:hypothetical protein
MGDGCSEHPDAIALAACTACGRRLCSGCVELALEGNAAHCAHCHAIAEPLPTIARPARTSTTPVARTIPVAAVVVAGGTVALPDPSWSGKIMSYMLARETLLVLAGLAAVTALLRWSGNTITWAMAAGLEASYFFHIVVDSAGGGKQLELPDFSSVYDDMIEPLRRYALTLVPIAAAIIWYGVKLEHDWSAGVAAIAAHPHSILHYPGPAALLVAGLALWPLMTAIAAIGRSVLAAYNPVVWFQSLRLFGMRYIAGAIVFYALLVGEAYAVPALAPLLSIPIAGAFAIQSVSILAMALRARVLGAVCEPYFEQPVDRWEKQDYRGR